MIQKRQHLVTKEEAWEVLTSENRNSWQCHTRYFSTSNHGLVTNTAVSTFRSDLQNTNESLLPVTLLSSWLKRDASWFNLQVSLPAISLHKTGQQLDMMIWEVFSNPNDPLILWFSCYMMKAGGFTSVLIWVKEVASCLPGPERWPQHWACICCVWKRDCQHHTYLLGAVASSSFISLAGCWLQCSMWAWLQALNEVILRMHIQNFQSGQHTEGRFRVPREGRRLFPPASNGDLSSCVYYILAGYRNTYACIQPGDKEN